MISDILSPIISDIITKIISSESVLKTSIFWLDAANSDSFGAPIVNNDPVSQWNDLSGNDNNAIQVTPSYQPTYVTNGINGLPSLDFDGGNDYLETQNMVLNPANTDFSIFIVVKFHSVPTVTQQTLLQQGDGSGVGRTYLTRFFVPSTIRSFMGNTTTEGSAIGDATTIYNLNLNAGSLSIYKNGSLDASNSVTAESATGVMYIGIHKDLNKYLLKGQIGEIIIFDRALGSSQRQAVEQYLSNKWGI